MSAAEDIAAAYSFDGPALELGSLVLEGAAHPESRIRVPLSMLNRHGLVAGATGTGKTKTLQLIAEQLSDAGVPVFLADIKGDVSGMAAPGVTSDRITKRATETGTDWHARGYPAEFLTLGGQNGGQSIQGQAGIGVPVRATMTSFGPVLLSKVLGLNETQESSLGLVFHFADKAGLPLLDLKDLRAVVNHLSGDEGKADLKELGGLSTATAGVILRELIGLEDNGGDAFFGEPEFDTHDLIRTAPDGRGILSIMELQGLQSSPQLFSTFLMWLLADLFHDLPEMGDVDKPKLVFFLDEAHLLFEGASKAFLDAVAQTVRLIRSKGVGVFFVTQTPKDVPGDVLAQLGNRIQHALRAFTPDDAKALKATVGTFPKSTVYPDLGELLTTLGIGDAVVTILSENGAPSPVAWTRMRPPSSLMAQLDPAQQQALVAASPLQAEYGTPVDRESAYELLLAKVAPPAAGAPVAAAPAQPQYRQEPESYPIGQEPEPQRGGGGGAGGALAGILGSSIFKSFARSAASSAGREISRDLFGTAPRRSTRRRRSY